MLIDGLILIHLRTQLNDIVILQYTLFSVCEVIVFRICFDITTYYRAYVYV